MFAKAPVLYVENLLYMPEVCFIFYIKAFTNFLLSPAAEGDDDTIMAFFGLVRAEQKVIKNLNQKVIQKC